MDWNKISREYQFLVTDNLDRGREVGRYATETEAQDGITTEMAAKPYHDLEDFILWERPACACRIG